MKPILFALALLPASLLAADSQTVGAFAPGETYSAPALHAPANVSRMFTRTVVRSGDSATIQLPATGDSSMIVWTMGGRARLTTPSGAVLDPADAGSTERGLRRFRFDGTDLGLPVSKGAQEVVHVARAVGASYRLDVDVPQDVATVTVVAAEPESRLTLETWAAPLSRQPGQPVTLHAELRDGGTAIADAHVTARLAPANGRGSEPVDLFDDGRHDDGAAGDGVYSAVLADLPQAAAGLWEVRFEAEGRTESGVPFARTGSGELVAEPGAARLNGDSVRATLAGDALHVTAAADVRTAGNYRFDVIVAGAEDAAGHRPALAWGEASRSLVLGANQLSLDIPRSLLGDTKDLRIDIRLLGLDTPTVAGRVEVGVE